MPASGFKTVTLVDDLGRPLRTTASPDGIHADLTIDVDVSETLGNTITTNADVAIGIGATVTLFTTAAIPAGSRRVRIQNTGPAGTFFRLREIGAGAGRGMVVPRFSQQEYGLPGGALAGMEAEEVLAGIATSVSVQFERQV